MLVFFAAISYEQRCVAALDALTKTYDRKDVHVHLLNYQSSATPDPVAMRYRKINLEAAHAISNRHGWSVAELYVPAYSMNDLADEIETIIGRQPDSHFVFDISCLTRPHVVSLARLLSSPAAPTHWKIAYSIAEAFGNEGLTRGATSPVDTLLLPIGKRPTMENEGEALGLALLGLESERFLLALEYIEPAAGTAVILKRIERPDLHRLVKKKSDIILRFLQKLELAGPRVNKTAGLEMRTWSLELVDLPRVLQQITSITAELVKNATIMSSPIVVFPFGPKLLIFYVCVALARHYGEASWVVYPVLSTHAIDSAEGVDRTVWMDRNDILTVIDNGFTSAD